MVTNGQLGLFCFLLTMIVFTFTLWQIYGPLQPYHAHIVQGVMKRIARDQNDYARLVNLTDFKFQIFENVCKDQDPFLLMMVASAPGHFERRKIIRETWGRNMSRVRVAFLLGAVGDEAEVERALVLENVEHRDMVQGNFLDSYKNLTYKHVMALKYATYHCSKAKYVLKGDDDVFVNTYPLLNFLDQQVPSDLMFCNKMVYSPALRDVNSKWYVSFEEFPDKYYPAYCSGFVVVYTLDVMSKLYKSAQRTKYFWVEDAHVTGILAKMNNLTQTDASRYILNGEDIVKADRNKTFFFGFNLPATKIEQVWKQVCC